VGPWLEEFRRLGWDPLINEHRVLQRGDGQLIVGGVTDWRKGASYPGHAPDVTAAFRGAPTDAPRLLLAHQPLHIDEAAAAGVALQMSGHTHGGQFVPFSLFVPLQQPYTAGLHRHGDTWIYVNRGAGYWGPPLRLGIPSEVTLLRLRTAG
jgi:predicted MPP superfamily phosphohydrolase